MNKNPNQTGLKFNKKKNQIKTKSLKDQKKEDEAKKVIKELNDVLSNPIKFIDTNLIYVIDKYKDDPKIAGKIGDVLVKWRESVKKDNGGLALEEEDFNFGEMLNASKRIKSDTPKTEE